MADTLTIFMGSFFPGRWVISPSYTAPGRFGCGLLSFAGARANGRVAPIPDLLGLARERLEPTCARHSESGSDNRTFSLMANEPGMVCRAMLIYILTGVQYPMW